MAQGTKPESERFPFGEPLVLRFDGEEVVGTLFNLSMTGMYIASEKTYPAGTDFNFLGHLDEAGATIQGTAKVAWRRRESSSSSRPAGMGAIFQRLDSNSRRAVRQLIETRQQESAPGVHKLDEKPVDFTTALIETLPRVDSSQFTPPPREDIYRAATTVQAKKAKPRSWLLAATVITVLAVAGWFALRLVDSMPGSVGEIADTNTSPFDTAGAGGAEDSAQPDGATDEPNSNGESRPSAVAAGSTEPADSTEAAASRSSDPGGTAADSASTTNPVPPAVDASDSGAVETSPNGDADAGDSTPAPIDPPQPAFDSQAIIRAVNGWARAWSNQNPDQYLAAYGARFRPDRGASRNAWEAQRRQRLTAPSSIEVLVSGLEVESRPDGQAEARFFQRYRSDNYEDVVFKTLVFAQETGGWKIVSESSRPASASELAGLETSG